MTEGKEGKFTTLKRLFPFTIITKNQSLKPIKKMKKNGLQLIAEERERQIKAEGYTLESDQRLINGELATAAIFYAFTEDDINFLSENWGGDNHLYFWPFSLESIKRSDNKIRNLQKAGALIAAEIDRLLSIEGGEINEQDVILDWYDPISIMGSTFSNIEIKAFNFSELHIKMTLLNFRWVIRETDGSIIERVPTVEELFLKVKNLCYKAKKEKLQVISSGGLVVENKDEGFTVRFELMSSETF